MSDPRSINTTDSILNWAGRLPRDGRSSYVNWTLIKP
jgi:hypothetical protein